VSRQKLSPQATVARSAHREVQHPERLCIPPVIMTMSRTLLQWCIVACASIRGAMAQCASCGCSGFCPAAGTVGCVCVCDAIDVDIIQHFAICAHSHCCTQHHTTPHDSHHYDTTSPQSLINHSLPSATLLFIGFSALPLACTPFHRKVLVLHGQARATPLCACVDVKIPINHWTGH
jgi:hypothetical protein